MRSVTHLLGVALAASLLLGGCTGPKAKTADQTGGPASIVGTAKDNASIVTCRTNRAQLGQLYSMAQSGATGAPADLAAIVQQSNVKCPSGGTYSWDTATSKARCTVHGE